MKETLRQRIERFYNDCLTLRKQLEISKMEYIVEQNYNATSECIVKINLLNEFTKKLAEALDA
jgi:hypothetical protein